MVFLSPLAALFALAALIPLAAFVEFRRRDRRVRAVLAIPPTRTGLVPVALTLVAGFLALAAAQPVLELGRERFERTDAEAYVVFDTSRSMLAASGPDAPTRLDRAERLAVELRRRLPHVPVGIASFTDRTLPHLFPSIDPEAFAATVARSVAIEQPPPSAFYNIRATRLAALRSLATANYFSPAARYRAVVVFTDGESEPAPRLAGVLRRRGVRPLFVHVWDEGERVYGTGDAPEPAYRPDPRSGRTLRQVGRTFGEGELSSIVAAAEAALGRGGETRARSPRQVALAPWITLAAALPLGLVLLRRNL